MIYCTCFILYRSNEIKKHTKSHKQSNAYALFVNALKIRDKDNLNLSRVQNTEITLKIIVQRETFEQFVDELELQKDKTSGWRTIYRGSKATEWWFRVCNASGDFAHIVHGTIQLWHLERECLQDCG